jgi:very-short-patch-repair endonuclease
MGITMVVEVDGASFHHETPVTAQDRLAMLSLEGVETYRVSAAECADATKAKACAEKILAVLQKKKSVR